jgi:copper(I)-binding protein
MLRALSLAAGLALATAASAADLRVTDAWIRLLPGGAPSGGYFTVHNDSGIPVELVGVRSPDFRDVMMHRTEIAGGNARMEPVARASVPAHGELRFAPGGYHLMLMQPSAGVKVGGEATVVLSFGGGRTLSARFPVRGPAG